MKRLAALLLLLPSLAWGGADNTIKNKTLSLYSTETCIGARLAWGHDANLNAADTLYYRVYGDSTWIQSTQGWRKLDTGGVVVAADSTQGLMSSIFNLSPATKYQVKSATLDEGVTANTIDTLSTQGVRDSSTASAPHTWWVDGSVSSNGSGSSGSPFKTIQAGINAATTAGDVVHVRAGTYYEAVTIDGTHGAAGTASAMCHLIGEPGTTIDGSLQAYARGGTSSATWTPYPGDNGIFYVPVSATCLVVVDSTWRLPKFDTLAGLVARSIYSTTDSSGYALDSGNLYVRLSPDMGSLNPSAHAMAIGGGDIGILVSRDYWEVRGFTVRYWGQNAGGVNSRLPSGVWIEANSDWANGCWFDSNSRRSISTNNANRALIENNLITDHSLWYFPWPLVKNSSNPRSDENTGIACRTGSQDGSRGCIIRYNVIRGQFDGMDTDGNGGTSGVADFDVYGNTVDMNGDDVIEMDSGEDRNGRLFGNNFGPSFSGVSAAPCSVGPLYITYNIIHDIHSWANNSDCTVNTKSGCFKIKDGPGVVLAYHNTAYTYYLPPCHAGYRYDGNNLGAFLSGAHNVHFRNNIIQASSSGWTGVCCNFIINGGDADTLTDDFDYDMLYEDRISPGGAIGQWGKTSFGSGYFSALSGLQGRVLPQEAHGRISVASAKFSVNDSLFVKASTHDYRLATTSRAIDAGCLLPGINVRRYNGLAPDMGAIESPSAITPNGSSTLGNYVASPPPLH